MSALRGVIEERAPAKSHASVAANAAAASFIPGALPTRPARSRGRPKGTKTEGAATTYWLFVRTMQDAKNPAARVPNPTKAKNIDRESRRSAPGPRGRTPLRGATRGSSRRRSTRRAPATPRLHVEVHPNRAAERRDRKRAEERRGRDRDPTAARAERRRRVRPLGVDPEGEEPRGHREGRSDAAERRGAEQNEADQEIPNFPHAGSSQE